MPIHTIQPLICETSKSFSNTDKNGRTHTQHKCFTGNAQFIALITVAVLFITYNSMSKQCEFLLKYYASRHKIYAFSDSDVTLWRCPSLVYFFNSILGDQVQGKV